jgi:hypothetical protein
MADQEKKPDDPKGDFPKAHKEVNYIYGGLVSCQSRRKQKLIAYEVMAVVGEAGWRPLTEAPPTPASSRALSSAGFGKMQVYALA